MWVLLSIRSRRETSMVCIESVLFGRKRITEPEEVDGSAVEFGEGALKRIKETCCWVELATRSKSHSSTLEVRSIKAIEAKPN